MEILHLFIFFSLGPFPNTLREVEVEIISNDICNQIHVYGGAVSSGMICAGFLKGKLDACEVRIYSHLQNESVTRDDLTEHRLISLYVTLWN